MTWKTLGESLEAALASIVNEVGDGDGCNRPDAVNVAKSRKSADPEGPASYREEQRHGGGEGHDGASRERMNAALPMGRRMTVATASPKAEGSPTRAAVIRLVIDNGGGPARAQGGVRPGRLAQAAGGGRTAASNLKLVIGGSGH